MSNKAQADAANGLDYHLARVAYQVVGCGPCDGPIDAWSVLGTFVDTDGSVRKLMNMGPYATSADAQSALRAVLDEKYPRPHGD